MKSQKKSALRLNQGHLVFDLRRSVRHLRIQDSTKGWALPNEVPDLLPQFRRNFRIEECLHPVDQHATGTPGTDWLAEFPREDGSGCSSARRHEPETRFARWPPPPPGCGQRWPGPRRPARSPLDDLRAPSRDRRLLEIPPTPLAPFFLFQRSFKCMSILNRAIYVTPVPQDIVLSAWQRSILEISRNLKSSLKTRPIAVPILKRFDGLVDIGARSVSSDSYFSQFSDSYNS